MGRPDSIRAIVVDPDNLLAGRLLTLSLMNDILAQVSFGCAEHRAGQVSLSGPTVARRMRSERFRYRR